MAPRPLAVVFVGAVLTLGSTAPASAAEDLFSALGAERLVTPRAAPDLALPADTVRGFARKLDIPFPLRLDKDGDSPRKGRARGLRDGASSSAKRPQQPLRLRRA